MTLVMCVRWVDRAGVQQWCAVEARQLDPRAIRDETLCANVVVLRTGSERRLPTCKDCLMVLRARRAAKQREYRKVRREQG